MICCEVDIIVHGVLECSCTFCNRNEILAHTTPYGTARRGSLLITSCTQVVGFAVGLRGHGLRVRRHVDAMPPRAGAMLR